MEHRSAYRVAFDEDDEVAVTVERGKRTSSARVFGLSYEGLGARLPREDDWLSLGDRVSLELTAPWLDKAVSLSARIDSIRVGQRTSRYGFNFVNTRELESQIEARLHGMFNRRSAVRVDPDPDEPLEVTLSAAEGARTICGRLKDISATGLSVRLAATGEAATFVRSQVLEASFRLPPGDTPVQMATRVCWGRLDDAAFLYGLEYDADLTERFQLRQDAILEYVMRRQRETLSEKLKA